jgi:hypothetical protein
MPNPVKVFITCPKCGHPNWIEEFSANRVSLAILRGIESPIKCKECGALMDTLTAYCGEQVGAEIVRREDPI